MVQLDRVIESRSIDCENGVVVRASASQSVDLRFISPSRVVPKDFNKWYSQLPCLALSTKGAVWRTSLGQGTCLHLYVANRCWDQAVYPSWWPSLTEDSQTDHELLSSECTSFCIMLSTIAQTTTTTKQKQSYVTTAGTLSWYRKVKSFAVDGVLREGKSRRSMT